MNAVDTLPSTELVRLPARRGVALRLRRGRTLKLINTHGKQVVDTWAFNPDDLCEVMSMEHSRPFWLKLNPCKGDSLVTNKRRKILTLAQDTTPGVHDTLVAACDPTRYVQLGVVGHHDSCNENLFLALDALGLVATETPSPLNLFMNVPVHRDGASSSPRRSVSLGSMCALRRKWMQLWCSLLVPGHYCRKWNGAPGRSLLHPLNPLHAIPVQVARRPSCARYPL